MTEDTENTYNVSTSQFLRDLFGDSEDNDGIRMPPQKRRKLDWFTLYINYTIYFYTIIYYIYFNLNHILFIYFTCLYLYVYPLVDPLVDPVYVSLFVVFSLITHQKKLVSQHVWWIQHYYYYQC